MQTMNFATFTLLVDVDLCTSRLTKF